MILNSWLGSKGVGYLGKALLAHEELDKSEQTMEECLAQARRINSEHIEMEAMLNLGKSLSKTGAN